MEGPLTFSDLWKLLTTTCKAPTPALLRKLQNALRNGKNAFVSPLSNPPKNQEHRQKLSQANTTAIPIGGRPTLLTPAEMQSAVTLSDKLNINEFTAVELLKSAQKQAQATEDPAMVAESVHFTERYYFLATLCNLIKGRMDQNLSSDLRAVIVDFTDDLLRDRDGLAKKLIRLLGTLNTLVAPLQNPTEDQLSLQSRYKDEMRSLAESIFFIFYQIPISVEETDTLVSTYKEVTKNVRFQTAPSVNANAAQVSSGSRLLAQLSNTPLPGSPQSAATLSTLLAPVLTLQPLPTSVQEYHVSFVLMITMCAAFAISGDNSSEWSSAKLLADRGWVSRFARDLSATNEPLSVWMAPVAFAFVLLMNELLERSGDPAPGVNEKLIESLVDRAMSADLFLFLREMVLSRSFQNDSENKFLYISVLDELLTTFICKMPMKVRQLRDQVELMRQLQQQQQQLLQQQIATSSFQRQSSSLLQSQPQTTPAIPKPHFVYLLRFAAALYPECGELHGKYWIESESPAGASSPAILLRITAESLSELIFVPFVDLLTALSTSAQSAAYAYEFLRRGSNVRYASWDHFFGVLKRYYIDFQDSEAQQQQQQSQQGQGGSSGGSWSVSGAQVKGIRAEDLLGLESILRLMAEVVRRNPASGLLMYETAEWRALETLFGLLGCPVPPSLKGHILNVIAAFATIVELVGKIWSLLEVAQVLPTASPQQQQQLLQQQQQQQQQPQQGGYAQSFRIGGGVIGSGAVLAQQTSAAVVEGGIRFELEEVESRYEEYPETLAFVRLLNELVSRSPVSMLVKLGSSYRTDGVLPYVRFVRDSVLLKFDARAYRIAGEQWRIASAALELMYLIVEPYEISSPNNVGDESQHSALILGKTPTSGANLGNVTAAEVVRDVLSTSMSSLLKKLISLINHGSENLEKQRYATDFGVDYERAVLFALKIIENVLRKESGQLVSSLDKLLMRDRQVLLNISRFINYSANSELVSLSVKIIDLLSLKQRLVSVFLESGEDEFLIRSYAERLQIEDEQPEDPSLAMTSSSVNMTSSSVRHAILQLLLRNISSLGNAFSTVPNFAHLLLGFDVNNLAAQSVTRTDLTLSTVPNCLSVLVSLLENASFAHVFPLLAESAYELLYRLIASPETADPTLRHLRNRSTGDFFASQLNAASTAWQTESQTVPPFLPHIYHRIFILRCLALELHMCALADHRAQLQSLLTSLFVAPSSEQPQPGADEDFAFVANPQQGRMKSLELLQLVSFAVPAVRPLPRGPAASLAQMIDLRNFAIISPKYKGAVLIDVKALHAFLISQTRLDVDHTISPAQYQQIQKEIGEILKNAQERNSYAVMLHAKQQLFDSWRQIVGITMSECYAYLPRGPLEGRERVLYALLGQLLDHLNVGDVADGGALSQGQVHVDHVALLGDSISATVLQLITKLREQKFGDEEFEYRGALPVAQLHSLLDSLLKAVMAVGASASMRSNLYASLSNYLQFTQKKIKALYALDKGTQFGTYLAADEIASQQRLLEQGNIRILEEIGERLVEMLSADAADGPLVCRAVSLACLDSLLVLDHQNRWLHSMWSRGFLRYFLETLSAPIENNAEQQNPILMLEPILFVYENLLSLFKRIASSGAKGARLLVEGGILSRLSGSQLMMLVSSDASSSAAAANFAGVPAEELAVQTHLLHHILQLLVALLTSLPRHEDLCLQTLDFISTHAHLISNILKDSSESSASLRTVYLTTSIFALLAPHYVLMNQKLGARAAKMEARLISLLLRLCGSTTADRLRQLSRHSAAMNSVFDQDETFEAEETQQQLQEDLEGDIGDVRTLTTRNLLTYCRIVMEKGGYGVGSSSLVQNALPRLLFAPRLASMGGGIGGSSSTTTPSASPAVRPLHDPMKPFGSPLSSSASLSGSGKAGVPPARPNLYALSHYLHTCVTALNRNVKNHETLTFKLTHLNELAPLELNKLARKAMKSAAPEERLSTNYKQHLAQWKLQELLVANAKESSTLMFIIETVLMLLWRHIELFLTATPTTTTGYFPAGDASAAVLSISKSEQDELRRDAAGSLSDSLSQIAKFDKPYKSVFANFLSRRLRELIAPSSSSSSSSASAPPLSTAPSSNTTVPSYLFRV